MTTLFRGSEALAVKALPERAMRSLYDPIYPGVYSPAGIPLSAEQRAKAAWLWSRRKGIVAGNSAAALLGARWVDPALNAELLHDNRHPPKGISVHSETVLNDELIDVGGITVTSPARTAFDIGRWTPTRLQAVQRLDALARATQLASSDVEDIIANHPGRRGLRKLREVLPLVDAGAESPQETRTRIALIDAGLPTPQCQVQVFDAYGGFVARIDMGYRKLQVGIEYDGPQHWTDARQRNRDIDRYTALLDLGWTIIRVSSELLGPRRATFIARVTAALYSAGWCPQTPSASVNSTTRHAKRAS